MEAAAAFASTWPSERRAVSVGAPATWSDLRADDLAVVADSCPWADVFAAAREALRANAWVALSAQRVGSLADRFGVPSPGGSVLVLRPTPAPSEYAIRWRDALVAGLSLVVVGPLLLVLAALVRWRDGPPAFYRAQVVGHGGRRFHWYKLRSLRQAAKAADVERAEAFRRFSTGERIGDADDTKLVDPARVTPVGAFLRRYSLDELPQVWNVIRGEMALVGPRPCLPYEYDVMADWQRERVGVRPGLTGLWQVFGRSRVGFEESMVLDQLYVMTRSWTLDLELIVRTVGVILCGKGGR